MRHRRRPQHSLLLPALTALLAVLPLPQRAQAQVGRAYCNVTDVTATQLSNAVRIEIRCDGRLDAQVPVTKYVVFDPKEERISEVPAVKRLEIVLENAKSKVGNLVDIGCYPVSHLELSPTPESRDGVGLDCSLAFYVDAATFGIHLQPDFIYDGWIRGSGLPPLPGEVRWFIEESEDRRGLVILVTSDRFPVAPPAEDEADEPTVLEVASVDGLLEVHAVHAPLPELLRAIGQESGVNCILSTRSRRRVSMSTPPSEPAELIEQLARAQGLSLVRQGDAFVLGESAVDDLASYGGSETRLLHLNYFEADEALRMLPVFLLRYVRADAEANALVATGSPALLDRIQQDLDVIDQPGRMIEVEVEVLTYYGEDGLIRTLGLSRQGRLGVADASPGDLQLGFARLGRMSRELEARIRALRSEGRLRVQTRQRLKILNGSQGSIFVGDQPTIVTSFFDYMRNETRPELTVIDVGARLEIEPWTGDGEEITVRVAPTVTSVRGVDPVSGMPILSVRQADGCLRIRNGHSVLLGGMTMGSESHTRHKLDLPFLGSLFRGRYRDETIAEFAFIITPRVVDTGRIRGTQ